MTPEGTAEYTVRRQGCTAPPRPTTDTDHDATV
jgi:hypothetical protein